ncbi:hypothetical protein HYS95_03900 [Candidatus Daviesbacteria bacterium]|nr:hypothetical protein [Candidatus Daviesbacteria bacterium]
MFLFIPNNFPKSWLFSPRGAPIRRESGHPTASESNLVGALQKNSNAFSIDALTRRHPDLPLFSTLNVIPIPFRKTVGSNPRHSGAKNAKILKNFSIFNY